MTKIKPKKLTEFDSSPVEWLIPNWIPRKGLTILFGPGGCGKSFLWISLASALSKGNRTILHPDGMMKSEEAKILFFSKEDSENVLYRRFVACEPNHENILGMAIDSGIPSVFTFGSDLLRDVIYEYKPDLLIFDANQSFADNDVDLNNKSQVRQMLDKMDSVASQTNTAILIISHSIKADASEARTMLSGTSDFWDKPRSIISFGNAGDDLKFIALEKANYANGEATATILCKLENGLLVKVGESDKKIVGFTQEQRTGKANPEEVYLEVICLLQKQNSMKMPDIISAFSGKYSDNSIKTAIKKLKERGIIHVIGGGASTQYSMN